MFDVQQPHMEVHMFLNATDARAAGLHKDAKYKGYTPLVWNETNVVLEGTVNRNPTLDLIMEDEKGNKYVAIVKGSYIKALAELLTVNCGDKNA